MRRRDLLKAGGALGITALLPLERPAYALARSYGSQLDVTGGWLHESRAASGVQTHEPALLSGDTRTFRQTLQLPAGRHALRFEYRPDIDVATLQRTPDELMALMRLGVDGGEQPLHFTRRNDCWIAEQEVDCGHASRSIGLALTLANTRPLPTTLQLSSAPAATPRFRALASERASQVLLAAGIPFAIRKNVLHACELDRTHSGKDLGLDRGSLLSDAKGVSLPGYGVATQRLHFLGMVHNIDVANGSWASGKGDHGYSHFVGDNAGRIDIRYVDGSSEHIPLVFGFNLWFSRPWDMNWACHCYGAMMEEGNLHARTFSDMDEHWQVISEALCLNEGLRAMGALTNSARFVFSLDLGGRAVASIDISGDPALHDFPLISAVTVETRDAGGMLEWLPDLGSAPRASCSITPAQVALGDWMSRTERVHRLLYTRLAERPALSEPQIPSGYFGPRYDFRGSQGALQAATFLYRNGPECASFIADSGTQCSSPTARYATLWYEWGLGIWRTQEPLRGSFAQWLQTYPLAAPGQLPGVGAAWSRAVGELMRESLAFGYDRYIPGYVDWVDSTLHQVNPPHWVRVIGSPEESARPAQVGSVSETGNRENDGHGICMWGRYMAWHWLGRSSAWNRQHFEATKASVEWLQWQLDTDIIRPGVRKDVLFTDSECAHESYDIYSTYNCAHGLKLAIRLAAQLGEDRLVQRWTTLHQRLRQGMLDHLVDASPMGPIWHTDPDCNWQDHAHKLVHMHLATDGDSYTPLQDYAADPAESAALAISRNSYRYLMREKNYNCVRMYGYGQGMMTQAALLLDEMADAAQFIDVLLKYAYLPQMEGVNCPEGIIVHRSGDAYVPVNGYMGQDSHVADATKAIRLTLGVDDNDPQHLRLVPRYPPGWATMEIKGFPYLGGNARRAVAYRYERQARHQRFEFELERDAPHMSVRLGPIPAQARRIRASLNGKTIPHRRVRSGDSNWIWSSRQRAHTGTIDLHWT